MLITIVAFIIILSILVLAHELGHFATAKLSGIKVEEFGMGFPPRIVGIRRGETIYSINAIPFGGFTKMLGEEDPTYPGSLASKSHATRIMVLAAGSVVNILLPILLFSISAMIPHDTRIETVQIKEVAQESPAQQAGMEIGDTILKIDSRIVRNRTEVSYLIQYNLGSKIDIMLQKANGDQKIVTVIPRWNPPPGQGATGIMVTGIDSTAIQESYPFWEAIPYGARKCWEVLILFRNEVAGWFIKGTSPQLTGPIGIAQLTGEVAKSGISSLLDFASLISVSLGVFNLFPFPGLDGGRLVFVILEWLRRGRRISPKKEGVIHLAGFVMLLMLILVITYFDILHIIKGDSILP
jgi:regulator of sigma E protease